MLFRPFPYKLGDGIEWCLPVGSFAFSVFAVGIIGKSFDDNFVISNLFNPVCTLVTGLFNTNLLLKKASITEMLLKTYYINLCPRNATKFSPRKTTAVNFGLVFLLWIAYVRCRRRMAEYP